MVCKIKIPLLTLLVTYAYRMHIQDAGMHAAAVLIEVDLFRKPSKIQNNCKRSLYIILNVLSNKTNLIYIAISLIKHFKFCRSDDQRKIAEYPCPCRFKAEQAF